MSAVNSFQFLLLMSISYMTLYLVLLNHTPTYIISVNNTLHILGIDNNTTLESCNPMYIVFETRGQLDTLQIALYSQYGFNISCSIDNNQISQHSTGHLAKHRVCQTFSPSSNSFSNQFCNGGRLYYIVVPYFLSDFSNKYKTNQILTNYCNQYHINDTVCNFKPVTFNLDDQKQRIKFLSEYINCNNNQPQPNDTWVLKEDKHKGSGVHFYNNHQLIYRLLMPDLNEQNMYFNNCKALIPFKRKRYFKKEGFTSEKLEHRNGFKVSYKHLVVQEFLSNPLLIENKAFHIRIYGLIPSFYKPFIALYFPQGIIYRTPNEYDVSDKNTLRTNGAVSGDYSSMYRNGSWFKRRWGFHKFQNWLNDEFGNDMVNYTTEKLNNDIKHITHHIFNASYFYNKIHTHKTEQRLVNGNIEIPVSVYCMDLFLTDTFELKLMETQFSCGICCVGVDDCDPVIDNDGHEWICDLFAKESTAISLEMYTKKSRNMSIDAIESLNEFEVAFWGND